jgi:hypothetical protein
MKLGVIFQLLVFSNMSFAIGWEEVSKDRAEERGISVSEENDQDMGCQNFKVSFPRVLNFNELGNRDFWSARYKMVSEKSKGWQLTSKGTQIVLPSQPKGQNVLIEGVCITASALENSYISAVYGGPQGTIPMVILLHLGTYK